MQIPELKEQGGLAREKGRREINQFLARSGSRFLASAQSLTRHMHRVFQPGIDRKGLCRPETSRIGNPNTLRPLEVMDKVPSSRQLSGVRSVQIHKVRRRRAADHRTRSLSEAGRTPVLAKRRRKWRPT